MHSSEQAWPKDTGADSPGNELKKMAPAGKKLNEKLASASMKKLASGSMQVLMPVNMKELASGSVQELMPVSMIELASGSMQELMPVSMKELASGSV